MGLIRAIASTASGLAAQRVRMDTVSNNVANLETTSTPEGGPYQRKVVRFASGDPAMPFANIVQKFMGGGSTGVVLTQVSVDTESPTRFVSDPSLGEWTIANVCSRPGVAASARQDRCGGAASTDIERRCRRRFRGSAIRGGSS